MRKRNQNVFTEYGIAKPNWAEAEEEQCIIKIQEPIPSSFVAFVYTTHFMRRKKHIEIFHQEIPKSIPTISSKYVYSTIQKSGNRIGWLIESK